MLAQQTSPIRLGKRAKQRLDGSREHRERIQPYVVVETFFGQPSQTKVSKHGGGPGVSSSHRTIMTASANVAGDRQRSLGDSQADALLEDYPQHYSNSFQKSTAYLLGK